MNVFKLDPGFQGRNRLDRALVVLVLASALLVPLAGCRKQEITVYNATKDRPETPQTTRAGSGVEPANEPGQREVDWVTPEGWEEKPPSGMRVGSFSVTGGDGQSVDISVIPLPGISGSELDNVNRWRGQLGLGPTDQDGLAALSETTAVGAASSRLYDLSGYMPADPDKKPSRMLVTSLATGQTTWFFKMTGPEALVAQQKPKFKAFLKSMSFHEDADPADSGSPRTSATPAPKEAPKEQAKTGADPNRPVWDRPSHWKEMPASAMRLATFAVEAGAEKADLSVVVLAGEAGGLLANVNRWRGQIQLPGIDEAELGRTAKPLDPSEAKAIVVDMTGQDPKTGKPVRVLGAIVPKAGQTWFYKMTGDDKLVGTEKEAFIKFVRSARYPNA